MTKRDFYLHYWTDRMCIGQHLFSGRMLRIQVRGYRGMMV